MELDSKNLGRLRRVANPRDVWTSESSDFTPWLAENIDVLADELGMTLTVVGTEVQVGEFRLDIRAEDSDGHAVVIENQLDRTDHSHLGQCLVYAAGLEASTVIWVAPTFRDEFRRTLDWLNERTDSVVNFFGVEVGVVQIGEGGPRAPVFKVIARPNGWQKEVKSSTSGAEVAVSALNASRQELFAAILTDFIVAQPSVRMPTRGAKSWITFASGPFGSWGLSVVGDGRLRVEAYIDTGDETLSKALFDEFFAEASMWEAKVGFPLDWERLQGKRACRIATYCELSIDDNTSREQARAWAADRIDRMFCVLNSELRERGKRIKAAAERTMNTEGATTYPALESAKSEDW